VSTGFDSGVGSTEPPKSGRAGIAGAGAEIIEQLETTKSEKLLAVVFAAFLLIGGIWAYAKIDDLAREAISVAVAPTPAEQSAISKLQAARGRVQSLIQTREEARLDLELRREAYRTALDSRKPAGALERAYQRAQVRFEQTGRALRQAERRVLAAQPEADVAERRIAAELERKEDRRALIAFLLRFGFVTGLVVAGYPLLGRMRARGSRFLPLAFSYVGFTVVLALVFAADYITDYADPLDLGPFILSLVGIVATALAFVALQRYLARRTPYRRVRKGECPFCGYPVGGTVHCEGCGRQVSAACAHCSAPRRVGTLRCGACGQA
jgi:hypothetical protein